MGCTLERGGSEGVSCSGLPWRGSSERQRWSASTPCAQSALNVVGARSSTGSRQQSTVTESGKGR
eukprot:382342-Amphidinium_carterae.2